jgi:DNA-binding transcriptional LysR family regulator
VSHSLAQLREHFNDPLLVRKSGRLELTARGNALLQPLSEALGKLNTLLGPPRSTLCRSGAGSGWPCRIMRRAGAAGPDALCARMRRVDFAISQASRDAMLAQLADGELDLALGIFPEVPQDIQCRPCLKRTSSAWPTRRPCWPKAA